MSTETMKQALEVLEQINQLSVGDNAIALPGEIDAAMDNLRAAIEQPLKIDPADCHIRVGEVSEPISIGKSSLLQEIVQAIRAEIRRSKLNNIRTAPKGDQTVGDLAVRVENLELLCEGIEGENYDQTSLELCEECGWRAMIPGEGCLTCARQKAPREWVELTDDEARALVNRATFGDRTNWQALVYMIDAKLKEKNG